MRQITARPPKGPVHWAPGERLTRLEAIALSRRRGREPYSRQQILEHDEEYAVLFREVRDLRRHHDAMVRRGDYERADAARKNLQSLGDPVLYQHRIWHERGRWNRYWQVQPSGLTHTSMACRSITTATVAHLQWELSGLPREVVARERKLCRHCGRMDTGEIADSLIRQFFRRHFLLAPCA